jgi:hypothetical protein
MPDEPKKTARSERLSLSALAVVLVLTNVWFFSQALTYVH